MTNFAENKQHIMIPDWITGIAMALLGGLNIIQVFSWRSERKRLKAEAASAEADAKKKSIDHQQDHYDFLQQKLTEWESRYYDVLDKLEDSINEKMELKNQIGELENTVNKQNTVISELKQEVERLSSRLPSGKKLGSPERHKISKRS